jgi:hypothetical protein
MFGHAVYNFFIGIAEGAQTRNFFVDASYVVELSISNASFENRIERISSF